MSLHYLVKCFCLKLSYSRVQLTHHRERVIVFKTLLMKILIQWHYHHLVHRQKDTYSFTPKMLQKSMIDFMYPCISSSTSFWHQLLHFRLTYSFTHHFFLFWFTTLLIHYSLSFTPGLRPTRFRNPIPSAFEIWVHVNIPYHCVVVMQQAPVSAVVH